MLVSHRQRVVVVEGPDRGLEYELSTTRMTVGSSPKNEVVLSDPTVSRVHCEIVIDRDRYVIRDLGSTNGTKLNGTPVVEAVLAAGSRVRLGDSELLFEPKKKWERVSVSDQDHFGELYGTSASMRSVFGLLARVGVTDLSCIITGETGTGKELAARALHGLSSRASKPLVVVDCGAISHTLIESELFGHEKGAFTGADRTRPGAFEVADGGTIFLDEVGELPIELQPKLLRVLERREVRRLGATSVININVRVLAATHRDLVSMVKEGKFREDLYYRLAEVVAHMPPLRARPGDIPLIAQRILTDHAQSSGTPPIQIANDGVALLQSCRWSGNVRELRNVLRRAAALTNTTLLTADDLRSAMSSGASINQSWTVENDSTKQIDLGEALPIKDAREKWMAPMEKEYLVRLIQRCNGDLNLASEQAGVHRKSLERLFRQHGIQPSDYRKK